MEPLKKLEELGISPAPWKPADDGIGYKDIWSNLRCAEPCEGEAIIAESVSEKDAQIMSAAPDMYDAIWDILFKCTKITNCRNCKGHELGNCGGCPLGKAMAALEKAGGAK